MTYPAEKLHPLGKSAAWGGSGARSVLTDVERCFNENSAAILEAPDIGRALQGRVLPILRHHYDTFIPDVPGEEGGGTPSAYVMAAGWRDGEPWILEITPSGMIGHYADIGFHAIGSGAAMAQQAGSLLSHFHLAERSVRFGCAAVLRVLQALDLTSASVGRALQPVSDRQEGRPPPRREGNRGGQRRRASMGGRRTGRHRRHIRLITAGRPRAVPLVPPLQRERGQPAFPADGPELVGRRELVGGVEGAEVDLGLVAAAAEDGGAAARAEMAVAEGARSRRSRSPRRPGRSPRRGTARRGACGSRGSGRGRPGAGGPSPRSARRRRGSLRSSGPCHVSFRDGARPRLGRSIAPRNRAARAARLRSERWIPRGRSARRRSRG